MEALAMAPATLALLAANLIVSFAGFSNVDIKNQNLFWIGPMRQHNQWYRMLSSGFLHANPSHLAMNMFVLFSFGMTLERYLGLPSFLIIYFASLIGGSAFSYLSNRHNMNYRALGASGATSGLLTAYSLHFPLNMLAFPPVPAIVFTIGFIGISYYLSNKPGSIIGHDAHLGGAVTGFVTAILLNPGAVGKMGEQFSALFG